MNRLRRGQRSRLGRDAFVEPSEWPVGEQPWDRSRRLHLLAARALTARLDDVVISHQSAADRRLHWRGSPAARSAARFADGLSESVGESRLRVVMDNHGLPRPALQVEIRDETGRLIGRVDFLLDEILIVEFDGALKYGSTADAVLAEKWREDRLRERGYGFARVGWKDFDRPAALAARLQRRLTSRH